MAETIVVFGATGVIGLGVVKFFLSSRNSIVVAPVRGDPEKLFSLLKGTSNLDRLHTPIANYLDEPEKVVEYIKAKIPGGKIDHVFLTAGGLTAFINATAITQAQLHDAIDQKVLSGVKASAALLPTLKDQTSSTYTVVTGGAGENAFFPAMGLLTIANSAQFGFIQALISETSANQYRVNELRIATVIRHDHESENPSFRGIAAAPSSAVAAAYVKKVVEDTATKGNIVRLTEENIMASSKNEV